MSKSSEIAVPNVPEMPMRSKALIIFLCFLVAVLEGYDLQAIGVALPLLETDMDLSNQDKGIILSGTMIGLMIGAIIGGWLGDRLGRKMTLAFSVLVFGAATIATAWAFDASSLTAYRLVTGIGIGAAMPNIMAIATDISSENNRAFTGMLMFCGFPVGAVGVAYLAQTVPDLDWKIIFYMGGIIPVILLPLFKFMPETAPAASSTSVRQTNGSINALFGGGRLPLTILLWTAFSLTLVILYLMLNWLPTLIVEKGMSRQEGASAALAFNIGSVLGALALGLLVDRIGLRWPLLAAYAILFTALALLANASDLSEILAYSAIVGACCVGSQFALYGAAPAFYPPAARSIGAGAAIATGRTGAIAGPLAAGLLMQGGMSGDEVLLAIAPIVALGGASVVAVSFFKQYRSSATAHR
tara:strand:+ start:4154 stop:5395 length:1242 start_codon:yes stop_codon:yes gene_type:complete